MQGAILFWIMFRTERIRGAYLRAIQRLLQQAAKIFWLAKVDEAAQRAVRIGCCRVDENACLRAIARCVGIDALTNASGVVSAFQRQLPNQ